MKVFLNRVDGIDDAIISMHLSKRTLTRELEMRIRQSVWEGTTGNFDGKRPLGALVNPSDALNDWLKILFKWGVHHYTMLRFIDLSFTVYGLHRGGQDDWDAHACRYNNRIIRASTRLGVFGQGEMSDFYKGKIIPTDVALAALGISLPDELSYEGKVYVRAVNGYILKGHEDEKDYKRGLYMLSIPSDFIFRVQLTEFAHVYKERKMDGTANFEVKEACEDMVDQLEAATLGYASRTLLNAIRN